MDSINIFGLSFSIANIGSIATFCLFLFGLFQYTVVSINNYKQKQKAQAINISSWIVSNDGKTAWIALSNQSQSPVYEIIVSLVAFQGAGDLNGLTTPDVFRSFVSVLPPGKYYLKTQGHLGMMFHPSSAIVFTDNAGINWIREGDGHLYKIDCKPMEYYNIPRPITWDYPLENIPEE